jgi:hypothetical protein
MDNKKPQYNLDTPIISVVSELHSYFRDLQSYYQIAKAAILGKIEGCHDQQLLTELQAELKEINRKIDYFHVLNNNISSADVILHTEEMIKEFNQ